MMVNRSVEIQIMSSTELSSCWRGGKTTKRAAAFVTIVSPQGKDRVISAKGQWLTISMQFYAECNCIGNAGLNIC